jgi:FkbM family methyltransferase
MIPSAPLSPSAISFKALTNTHTRVRVVDIGASPIDGTPPYWDLLRAGMADVVGFEPNPEALAKLNEKKGPNELYLPYAIGDGRRHTLRICAAPGMTSLLMPNLKVLNRFHGFSNWARVVATQEIDTVRLDEVEQTAGMDLLKIDIQGSELLAFSHGEARLRDALVIQTEVEFLQMYVDQPLFSDVELFLRQRGFVFHRFFTTVSRVISPLLVNNDIYAGMSQILWADALFVRDFTQLELLSDSQLLRFAAIMHDCYQSIDLVVQILSEYDCRCGTQLGAVYLSGLRYQSTAAKTH